MHLNLYPNQKAVRIIKENSSAANPYSIFNRAALDTALKVLKPNGFRLWAYLNANQTNYEMGLSMEAVKKATGMCKNTYYLAIEDLVKNGYLVKAELKENLQGYLFIEGGYRGETECGEKMD